MKRTRWAVVLVMVLVASLGLATLLGACGEAEEATTTAPPTTQPGETTTTVAPTTTTDPGVPDTGQTFDLKMTVHVPERASIVVYYYAPWIEAVKEATGGRVNITLYPDQSLVKEADQYDAVLTGLADIAAHTADATPGRFPMSEFYTLPFLFPDAETAGRVYWEVLHNSPAAAEWEDIVILGNPVIAASQYFGNKPAKLPADLKGQRVRSGGKVEAWLITQLGGTPVDIATGDLATSMERGVADSTFLSYSFAHRIGVTEVTRYRTEVDMFYRAFVLTLNRDVWESMPKVLQDQIMSVSTPDVFGKWNAANEAAALEDKTEIETADKERNKPAIHVPTPEELGQWKQTAMPVWDKWVQEAGGEAQAVLDLVVQLAGN